MLIHKYMFVAYIEVKKYRSTEITLIYAGNTAFLEIVHQLSVLTAHKFPSCAL